MPMNACSERRRPVGCVWLLCLALTVGCVKVGPDFVRPTAEVRGGKLVCLFGCGGERDRTKRPVMGAIAERLADRVVVTSDNPRSEDPLTIIAAIRSGMQQTPVIEADRARAIAQAITQADTRDVILLAGKGHEPYQEIAGVRLPFSDIDTAKSALARRQSC